MGNKIVTIAQTDRLNIRELKTDDTSVLSKILGDPSVMEFSSNGPLTEADTEMFIEWCTASYQQHGYGQWASIDKASGQLIGFSGLSHAELDGVDEVEVAYRLAKHHWGKGLATEAVRSVINHGFAHCDMASIIGIVSPRHVTSIRVLEKVGFQSYTETHYSGWDVRVYRLKRSDWERLNQ